MTDTNAQGNLSVTRRRFRSAEDALLIGVNVILQRIDKIGMLIEFSFKLITMLILAKS
jgi:hypothetical protein